MPVNEQLVKTLLNDAQSGLNTQELAYIRLLCFWLHIHFNLPSTQYFSELKLKGSPLYSIPESSRPDFVNHMFRHQILLGKHGKKHRNKGLSSFKINENQYERISACLRAAEHDPSLPSRDKETLFHDYYLIPLYQGMHDCIEKSISLDHFLNEPFAYRFEGRTEPITDIYIAKAAAYHLCRTADASQDGRHERAYRLCTSSNRLAYYETVKRYHRDDIASRYDSATK